MGKLSDQPRAWLELLRISNLPTVFSNVLVGTAIGCSARTFPWIPALVMALAVGLLYIGGMADNDAADHEIDRLERPSRPIPSGRISLRAASLFAESMFAVGLLIALYFSLFALAFACGLVVLIKAYNQLHRKTPGTVLLMGGCRGMAYLVAAAAVAWPLNWLVAGPLAGLLTAYTVSISLVARREAEIPRRIALVHGMLAGISLLDMAFLLFLGHFLPAGVAFVCFLATVLLHRVIKGT